MRFDHRVRSCLAVLVPLPRSSERLGLAAATLAFAAVLAAPPLSAQGAGDRVYPIRAEPKIAGTYDLRTGRLVRKAGIDSANPNLQVVYNNTCSWSGGSFYLGTEPCQDTYDEGRVPLVANGGAGALGTSNAIDSLTIGYCTWFPTGSVDIDLALFDTNQLGGACLGGVPPVGVPGLLEFNSSAAGFPLPGSPALGVQMCWIVTFVVQTPVCLQTGLTTSDLFNWRIRFNQQFDPASPDGPIQVESTTTGGQGTYDNAPAVDPLFGTPCGNGLGNTDSFWFNFDGVPVGGPPLASCGSGFASGTGCYFSVWTPGDFGSYFSMTSRGPCVGSGCDLVGSCDGNVSTYCTAKTNSAGCVPTMTASGYPAWGVDGGFELLATNLLNNKAGLLFYGTNGAMGANFQGGHLCVKGPIIRTSLQSSGSCSAGPCGGSYRFDFNEYVMDNLATAPDPGQSVWAQYWSRDPASPSTTSLTNAVAFTMCPPADAQQFENMSWASFAVTLWDGAAFSHTATLDGDVTMSCIGEPNGAVDVSFDDGSSATIVHGADWSTVIFTGSTTLDLLTPGSGLHDSSALLDGAPVDLIALSTAMRNEVAAGVPPASMTGASRALLALGAVARTPTWVHNMQVARFSDVGDNLCKLAIEGAMAIIGQKGIEACLEACALVSIPVGGWAFLACSVLCCGVVVIGADELREELEDIWGY